MEFLVATLSLIAITSYIKDAFNPLSANPTKWSNTLKQLFDHFVGLALKGLRPCRTSMIEDLSENS